MEARPSILSQSRPPPAGPGPSPGQGSESQGLSGAGLQSQWRQTGPLSCRGSSLIGRELPLVMLAPAVLCHKVPARASRHWGVFCLPLAGSLWHKDSWLPCTERSYYRRPYAIKNQRGDTDYREHQGLIPSPHRFIYSTTERSSSENEKNCVEGSYTSREKIVLCLCVSAGRFL